MAPRFAFLIVASIASLNLVFTAPSPEPRLKPRQNDGCTSTNSEAEFESSCWTSLGLTDYLTDWRAPSVCTDQNFGVDCCNPNEIWSTCFLRLGTGHAGYNCSQIQVNTNNCAFSDQLAPNLTSDNRAQVRYILKTMFNINAFFNDWYIALQYATTQTALSIDPIVAAVDPPTGLSLSFTDVLTALVAGLPFIGSPIFAAEIGASAAAKAFVTGLQQTPGLIKSLFPTGEGSDTIQIGTLSTELQNAVTQIGDRINAGLWTLMSDQNAFATFASSGAFTGDPSLSIPQQVKEISNGLELFVLSNALVGNKYRGEFIGAAAADETFQNEFCNYQGQNICYRDGTLLGGVIAFLTKPADGGHPIQTELMNTISQNGWASPQELYQSAVNCAASGQFGQNLVNLNSDGSISFDCLNQLVECYNTDRLTTCSFNGGACPIQNCT